MGKKTYRRLTAAEKIAKFTQQLASAQAQQAREQFLVDPGPAVDAITVVLREHGCLGEKPDLLRDKPALQAVLSKVFAQQIQIGKARVFSKLKV